MNFVIRHCLLLFLGFFPYPGVLGTELETHPPTGMIGFRANGGSDPSGVVFQEYSEITAHRIVVNLIDLRGRPFYVQASNYVVHIDYIDLESRPITTKSTCQIVKENMARMNELAQTYPNARRLIDERVLIYEKAISEFQQITQIEQPIRDGIQVETNGNWQEIKTADGRESFEFRKLRFVDSCFEQVEILHSGGFRKLNVSELAPDSIAFLKTLDPVKKILVDLDQAEKVLKSENTQNKPQKLTIRSEGQTVRGRDEESLASAMKKGASGRGMEMTIEEANAFRRKQIYDSNQLRKKVIAGLTPEEKRLRDYEDAMILRGETKSNPYYERLLREAALSKGR